MTLNDYYLQQMGIHTWVIRPPRTENLVTLEGLASTVAACTRCPLHASRTQSVFARGNPKASLMIVGGAPGVDDDQQGLPFVAKAGALLNNMIHAMGLTQEQVYIANVLKCHPPNDRNPEPSELAQCGKYLSQQIALVQPKVLLAVGRVSGQHLLNTALSLTELRTKVHQYQGIKVIVSYHPADLLRHPKDKKNAYQDWVKTRQLLL